MDESHCPSLWQPWMGPEFGINHRGVWFSPSSANKISPDTIKLFNGDWELNHAWYQFAPSPIRSLNLLRGPSPENGYMWYRLEWRDPEAEMACRYSSNVWFLTPVKTRGETIEISEDQCDDPEVQGCEDPEGGGGALPGSPIGGGGWGGNWVCDIYYQYDMQTGEIVYWTVLQCYET
jgi:hypothetical protein